MTTLARLPPDRYPWTWALRIHTSDGAKFRRIIADIKRHIPARARRWDKIARRWLFREPETIASILEANRLPYSVEVQDCHTVNAWYR